MSSLVGAGEACGSRGVVGADTGGFQPRTGRNDLAQLPCGPRLPDLVDMPTVHRITQVLALLSEVAIIAPRVLVHEGAATPAIWSESDALAGLRGSHRVSGAARMEEVPPKVEHSGVCMKDTS